MSVSESWKSKSDDASDSDDSFDINDCWGELPEGVTVDDGQGGDEGEETRDLRVPGAEHLMVLLDCSPGMFTKSLPDSAAESHFDHEQQHQHRRNRNGGDGGEEKTTLTSPADTVIKSLQEYVRYNVRTYVKHKTGKRNGFGLMVYDTRERSKFQLSGALEKKPMDEESNGNDSDDSDHEDNHPRSKRFEKGQKSSVHQIIPLEKPGISTIRVLRQCSEDENGRRVLDLDREFGHCQKVADANEDDDDDGSNADSLQTALNEVSQVFKAASCVKKTTKTTDKVGPDKKYVWIFTNQTNPCGEDSEQAVQRQELLFNVVTDMKESGFEFFIWPLPAVCNTDKKWNRETLDFSYWDELGTVPNRLRHLPVHCEDFELNLDEILAGQWKLARAWVHLPLLFPVDNSSPASHSNGSTNEQALGTSQESSDSDPQQGSKEEEKPSRIMLDFYLPISFQTEPAKVKILREMGVNDDNVEVERVTQKIVESTGELLATFRASSTGKDDKEQEAKQPGLRRLRTRFRFGKTEDWITISKNEVGELKRRSNLTGENAGLTLLGFKPRDAVPFHLNMKSYFVYPSDTFVEGSIAAFAHLHRSMMKKDVVGIGELLLRGREHSKLVAIYAMPEETKSVKKDDDFDEEMDEASDLKEEAHQQTFPPGWIVTILPFENEVRAIPADASCEQDFDVPANVMNATAALVNKTFARKGIDLAESFHNQYLEKFWDYVESIALREPMPLDKVYNNEHLSDEAVAELRVLAETLKLDLPEDDISPPTKQSAGTKRQATSDTDWVEESRKGNLRRYKLDDLREACRFYGLKVSGKKDDLVARIMEAVNNGG